MRNLLGRLNARNPDELHRVGRFWRVTLSGNDRGRHVGALYRTMTDVRAVRDAWDRLDAEAQLLVRELALADAGALTVAELASRLEQPPTMTHDAAARLFRAGILSREGDAQELAIGTQPRLFLPRELVALFRRVHDEIDAGDLSGASLPVLLELLDDAELEGAGALWGIKTIPGLRRRSELIGQIRKQIAVNRLERVVSSRGADAAALWGIVRAANGEPVSLPEALQTAGLAGSADDIRLGERVRRAQTELETSLLVWHTYHGDGSRWLFVPRDILSPPAAEPDDRLPVQSMVPETVVAPPATHPHALAWDLLTLLRELSAHGGPLWAPGDPLPRAWQRRLNGRLWFGSGSGGRPDDVPPPGYLGFLLHLALGVGVVEPGERAPGEPKEAIRPKPSDALRSWRGHRFADQTARLRAIWLASDEWEEGREREEIEVWGADWRGFRHRLRRALGTLPEDEWLPLEDAARLLAESDPTLLGATFTAASARATSADAGEGETARTATVARVVTVALETAFVWFGLVEIGTAPGVRGSAPALRVTEAGHRAAADDADVPADSPLGDGPPLTTAEDGRVTLRQPSPIRVWSLSAFGDQEALWPVTTYRLTPASLGRALAAGFDLDQVVTFLERQGGAPLPPPLAASLLEWTAGYRRVRLRRAVLLHPDTPTARDELRRALADKIAGIELVDLPRARADDAALLALLPPTGDDGDQAESALLAALRDAGYTGQWLTPGPTPRARPDGG